jgi:hypothetical protein
MTAAEAWWPPCDEPYDDLTSIRCERPAGHPGEHEGYSVVTWPRDDEAADMATAERGQS